MCGSLDFVAFLGVEKEWPLKRKTRVQILAPLFANCMSLDKMSIIIFPQVAHV